MTCVDQLTVDEEFDSKHAEVNERFGLVTLTQALKDNGFGHRKAHPDDAHRHNRAIFRLSDGEEVVRDLCCFGAWLWLLETTNPVTLL